jgi:hypothetical protein
LELELRGRGVFVGVWGMMHAGPRRVYRSRLFWLGVPGLVFLVWAWWDSGERVSSVRWVQGDDWHIVCLSRGRLEWQRQKYIRTSPMWGIVVDPFGMGRGLHGEVPRLMERLTPAFSTTKDESVMELDFEVRSMALWVPGACHVMIWLGAVFWWQRRKRKAANRLTEVEVAS